MQRHTVFGFVDLYQLGATTTTPYIPYCACSSIIAVRARDVRGGVTVSRARVNKVALKLILWRSVHGNVKTKAVAELIRMMTLTMILSLKVIR